MPPKVPAKKNFSEQFLCDLNYGLLDLYFEKNETGHTHNLKSVTHELLEDRNNVYRIIRGILDGRTNKPRGKDPLANSYRLVLGSITLLGSAEHPRVIYNLIKQLCKALLIVLSSPDHEDICAFRQPETDEAVLEMFDGYAKQSLACDTYDKLFGAFVKCASKNRKPLFEKIIQTLKASSSLEKDFIKRGFFKHILNIRSETLKPLILTLPYEGANYLLDVLNKWEPLHRVKAYHEKYMALREAINSTAKCAETKGAGAGAGAGAEAGHVGEARESVLASRKAALQKNIGPIIAKLFPFVKNCGDSEPLSDSDDRALLTNSYASLAQAHILIVQNFVNKLIEGVEISTDEGRPFKKVTASFNELCSKRDIASEAAQTKLWNDFSEGVVCILMSKDHRDNVNAACIELLKGVVSLNGSSGPFNALFVEVSRRAKNIVDILKLMARAALNPRMKPGVFLLFCIKNPTSKITDAISELNKSKKDALADAFDKSLEACKESREAKISHGLYEKMTEVINACRADTPFCSSDEGSDDEPPKSAVAVKDSLGMGALDYGYKGDLPSNA